MTPDRDVLEAYLDGELSAEQVADLEEQVSADPELADALVLLARDEAILKEWACASLAANGVLRLRAPRRRLSRRYYAAGILTAAAAVLLAVYLGVFTSRPAAVAKVEEAMGKVFVVPETGEEFSVSSGQELKNGQRLRTEGDGSFAVVTYADLTRLELGADTTIRLLSEPFPTVSDQLPLGKRVFLEQGIVAANVSKQPDDHPMVLATAHAEARLDETRANFSSAPEETRIEQEQGQTTLTRTSDGRSIEVPTGFYAVAAGGVGQFVRQPLPKQNLSKPRLTLTESNAILAALFSPDGSTLAAGLGDGTVKQWDVATGNPRLTFKAHGRPIRALAFSPDGSRLLTGNEEKLVKLFDPSTGNEKSYLRGHKGRILAIACAPDGSLIASAGIQGNNNPELRLWDPSTREELASLTGHANGILALAFSPDSQTLASASKDGTIKLWDLDTRTVHQTLTGHRFWVTCLAFSPDGGTLASGSRDRTVKLWDLATGTVSRTLQGHVSPVRSVAFSPDGSALATADLSVRLWDPATGQETLTFKGQHQGISAVAFSPDGKSLATAGWDRTLRLWDLPALNNAP